MCDEEKEFMEVQIHKIEIDKWVQGERQDSDPGEEYVIDWVYENAKNFRDGWNGSICKNCALHLSCGWNLLSACEDYKKGDVDEEDTMS